MSNRVVVTGIGIWSCIGTDVNDVSFPGVEDCICVAGKHPVLGNILKLLVKYSPEQNFDKRALARFINETLETYKVPQRYELVEQIRTTGNGQKDRKSYREE